MKYIDLHLHLDGAISLDIAKKLASMQGIELEDDQTLINKIQVSDDCTSLDDFLKCFDFPCSLLQTKEALSEAVYLVLKEREDHMAYCEIRFAPQLHTRLSMTQEDAIQAALEGLNKANVKANLILCCMRGNGNEAQNIETVKLAKKYLCDDGGVVAIDLAGAEGLFKTSNYKDLFSLANEYGIPFTIHAGEADDSSSIIEALNFGAKRIGHGVRNDQNPLVYDLLKANDVLVEMCPTSNIMTHAIENYDDYPLKDYLELGIPVCINTDDPAIENTNIIAEYDKMIELYDLSTESLYTLINNAINYAFVSDEAKEEIRELVKE